MINWVDNRADNWAKEMRYFYKKLPLFLKKKQMKKKDIFSVTKFDQMSGVGSRDRHTGWRSKNN